MNQHLAVKIVMGYDIDIAVIRHDAAVFCRGDQPLCGMDAKGRYTTRHAAGDFQSAMLAKPGEAREIE